MGIITSDRTQNIQNEHHSACWSIFFIIYPQTVWSTEHTAADSYYTTTLQWQSDKGFNFLVETKRNSNVSAKLFYLFFLSRIISLRFITKVNKFLSADKLKQTDVQTYQRNQETRFISHLTLIWLSSAFLFYFNTFTPFTAKNVLYSTLRMTSNNSPVHHFHAFSVEHLHSLQVQHNDGPAARSCRINNTIYKIYKILTTILDLTFNIYQPSTWINCLQKL